MVISKKYFELTAHPETKWPSQQNILFSCFFHFTNFSVPFADTISTKPSPKSFQCHLESVWLKKVMRPKIKISLVKCWRFDSVPNPTTLNGRNMILWRLRHECTLVKRQGQENQEMKRTEMITLLIDVKLIK